MSSLAIIGMLGIIFTSAQLIPQVIKAYRTKSVGDLSLLMLVIILLGAVTWVIYGYIIKDSSILIANCINLAAAVALMFLKLRSRVA